MSTVVEATGLAKVYPNGTAALAPVDLSIARGEFVTLLGPSGCGKTTLLNLIAGLVVPSAGSLRWWGSALPPIEQRDRKLEFVFQSPTLMPWARVSSNVRLPLDLAGVPRAEGQRAAEHALAQVGLGGFEHHLPRELSGGMQMRASIARALVNEPDLLLMDEPFGALDAMTREEMNLELQRIWNEQPKTVLFITHSIDEAVFLSDRVVVMTPRPGGVRAIIDVELPRPRTLHVREHPRFIEHVGRIRDLIWSKPGGAIP